MDDEEFLPEVLTISAGDTVYWIWEKSSDGHNIQQVGWPNGWVIAISDGMMVGPRKLHTTAEIVTTLKVVVDDFIIHQVGRAVVKYYKLDCMAWVRFARSSEQTILRTRPYTRQHQSRAGGQGQYSSWAGAVTQI